MKLSTALLVLASATVALAQQAILSKGLLVARDTSDHSAEGSKIFSDERNHVIATASILRRAAQSSNYSPAKQDPTKARTAFYEFQFKAASFLGFDEIRSPIKKQLKLKGGRRDLEETIKRAYDTYEASYIGRTLSDLVPESNKNPENKQFVLSIVSVNKRNNDREVKAKLINLTLRLETSKDGAVEVPAQSAYLYAREFLVDAEYLKENADKLAQNVEKASANEFKSFFESRALDRPKSEWFESEEGSFDF